MSRKFLQTLFLCECLRNCMLGSCERAHSSNEYLYAESTLFKGVETGIEVEKPVFNIIQVYTLNYFCKAQTYHNTFQERKSAGPLPDTLGQTTGEFLFRCVRTTIHYFGANFGDSQRGNLKTNKNSASSTIAMHSYHQHRLYRYFLIKWPMMLFGLFLRKCMVCFGSR